jgi:hypothetical protein
MVKGLQIWLHWHKITYFELEVPLLHSKIVKWDGPHLWCSAFKEV